MRQPNITMIRRRTMIVLWVSAQALPAGCSHQQPEVARRPSVVAEVPSAPQAPPPPTSEEKADSPVDARTEKGNAIFFEFDSALLEDDARAALARLADEAKHLSNTQLTIEGNCDELGTIEYNLALGQHRAEAAKQYLVHMGVSPQKITTASYGSQRPRYPGHDDVSRSKNRRDDLIFRSLRARQ